MLPVSHTTVPPGTISYQTVSVDHSRCLIHEWTEWASSAPPGNGECRSIAVKRMKYCLENNTDWLDLSELHLTVLPENLPASIQGLDVSDNQLTALPATLPALLEALNVSHNRLTALPERLLASIQLLDVSYNQLTFLPATLPTLLEWLDASNNRLVFLPATLPVSLRKLDVSFNRLTFSLETLPASLQQLYAYNNQLITLPGRLPASLQELYVSHNRLTALPETLPASLRELNVTDNGLTSLPTTLPISLESLYVSNNQLTTLAERLPASLQRLDVSDNQLTALPENLPASLEWLHVNNNQLTSLPRTLSASLQFLDARNNWLTALPATLPTSLRRLDISNNRLTFLPLNLTLFIDSLVVSGNPLVGLTSAVLSDFLGTIAHWTGRDNAPQWQKIQSEDGAMVFAEFLHKLHRGKNSLSEALYGRIREWLGYLAAEENSELRKQTFLVAEEAVTSCVDRAAFYFNKMYWLMMEDRAIKSGVDAAHLIETIRSGFRLQVLERIAGAHAQRRLREAAGFAEDIEIYLAYQYRLREALSLPVYTELQFAALAGLTEQDIEVAQATVLRQEQTDFLRYLVTESTAWRQRLQSWDKGKTAAVEANYLEAITSTDFSAAVDRELKENGLPVNDSDARRAVCKKIAEAWLFTARLRLTEDYLTAHKALPCLVPFRG